MTDIRTFPSAQLKVDRALRHIAELRDVTKEYLASRPYTVTCEVEDTGGISIAYAVVRRHRHIPAELAAIIGDIIHNLRVSLDLLANDLVRISHGPDAKLKGVYYPFCNYGYDFDDVLRRRGLSRIAPPLLQLLKETKPYKGGNDGLRILHDIDIQDKHQSLLPVATVAAVSLMAILPPEQRDSLKDPRWTSPINSDKQMLVAMPAAWTVPHGTEIPCEFPLIFDAGSALAGHEIFKALTALHEGAQRIIQAFTEVALTLPAPALDTDKAPSD